MKKLLLFFALYSYTVFGQTQEFIDSDIQNFWTAYDKILKTTDTVRQYQILQTDYLDRATPGLKSLQLVRNYTPKSYLESIKSYPRFWQSIRKNTLSANKHFPEIEADLSKLKALYPNLKAVPIYFSVGAFRTGGTVYDGKVLIGVEASLADQTAVIDELPDWRKPFYKNNNPVAGLPLLCTHEYIHSQQKEMVGNLLSKCLYEGVAEFISCLATGKKSDVPAIAFGKANQQKVAGRFISDMYKMTHDSDWIWGENTNEFKMRDLGYYIGYEICERYYERAHDKKKAVAELIELDYRNEAAVEHIVDGSGLFPKPVAQLYADYEASRPTVVEVKPFGSNTDEVRPMLTNITVHFSEPLNGYNTGVDFGPLGQDAFPAIIGDRTWSADARSWTFQADLKPGKKYQILISNNFRKADGTRLKPFLIEFSTTR